MYIRVAAFAVKGWTAPSSLTIERTPTFLAFLS
jgi:hypothetical protein